MPSDPQVRVEEVTQEIGRYLFEHLRHRKASIFEKRWWEDRILSWAMGDEAVKVQMFRFVDVLPRLKTHAAVARHLQEYFEEVSTHLPGAARLVLDWAEPNTVLGRALAVNARSNATRMAQRFIAGSTVDEVSSAVGKLRKQGFAFTLDLLGEATISAAESDSYQQQYLNLIAGLTEQANQWPEDCQLDCDHLGTIPRVNVSLKLSALCSHFRPVDPTGTTDEVLSRLRPILRAAREHGAYIHVDMEQYAFKDLTLDIFQQVLMEAEFRDFADVGIVIQAYLPDAESDLQRLLKWSKKRGTPVTVRLVKGAYWDYETVSAGLRGWPVPVFQEKWQSDANFEKLARLLMENYQLLRPALASHNLRSLANGIAWARQLKVPIGAYEIQMLYGMGDSEKQVLTDLGRRVRVYMPYGELIPGMAYLVRRLLENTANDSFLKAGFVDDVATEKLAMHPAARAAEAAASLPSTTSNGAPPAHRAPPEFRNEPPRDFSREDVRADFRAALDRVRAAGRPHRLLGIGGRDLDTATKTTVVNPSCRAEILGTVTEAGPAEVAAAIEAAGKAAKSWGKTPVAERASLLRRTAAAFRKVRDDLSAAVVLESGKPWREADGDVAEAIDFLEYYALAAEELDRRRGVRLPGEDNRFVYLPRGITAVIAPWNFPAAILTGMAAAALATGNPVIMKPAEQTPLIARRVYDLFRAAGVPDGVLTYLPGRGEIVGAGLVASPRVALVVFTGSREVGLTIHATAARVSAEAQAPLVKRVIAEMGGKNAIVVDELADLDEAVLGVLHSAFGYSGQKCSACSRVIVHANVYEDFLRRLTAAAKTLPVGPADAPGTVVGPLIDEEALKRVRRAIQAARDEAREVLSVSTAELSEQGCYVGPHIFADVRPDAAIARDEVFGPVLAVLKAESFEQALDIANGVDYALTGAVYSRNPARLEQASRDFEVGNLYLNRPSTGALVGRQPFGGYKLSGIGSQAGGPDYLLQFVVPRTITENTLRRGFAPEEGE